MTTQKTIAETYQSVKDGNYPLLHCAGDRWEPTPYIQSEIVLAHTWGQSNSYDDYAALRADVRKLAQADLDAVDIANIGRYGYDVQGIDALPAYRAYRNAYGGRPHNIIHTPYGIVAA